MELTKDFDIFNKDNTEIHNKKYKIINVDKDIFDKEVDDRINSFFDIIIDNIFDFHTNNCANHDGVNISFGLLRFPNIKPIIEFCEYYSKKELNYEINLCSYHSADILAHRSYKEHRLDFLLNRKHGNEHIYSDEDIKEKIRISKSKGHSDIIFLIAASPVEEVGRDHDFDWGIIDFSSMHSLVQTAGRVNRHRKIIVDQHNIGVLRYNYKCIENGDNKPCFKNPGFETDSLFSSHDIAELLTTEKKYDYISKLFRYSDCLINECEFQALQNYKSRFNYHIKRKKEFYMSEIYRKYSLRNKFGEDYVCSAYDDKYDYVRYFYKDKSYRQENIDVVDCDPNSISWMNENNMIFHEIEKDLDENDKRNMLSFRLNSFGRDINNLVCVYYKPWGYRLENR